MIYFAGLVVVVAAFWLGYRSGYRNGVYDGIGDALGMVYPRSNP